MNKKLIALAVAAAAMAPAAFANGNEVVLYGQVNVGVQLTSYKGDADQLKVTDLSSRIGVKGQEDLGNGTKAWFKVETSVKPDTAAVRGFGSREAWVGLKGDFGQFGLGRGKSPYVNATEEFDPFYHDESLGLTGNGPMGYRLNNSVRYDVSTGPFSFAVMNSFGEDKAAGLSATNEFSAYAKYSAENVMVIAALDINKTRTAGKNNPNAKMGMLGATVTLGDLALSAAYQHRDAGGNAKSMNDFLALATYSMGNLSLNGGVIVWDEDQGGKDQGKVQGNFGAFYNLSKRTAITFEHTHNYNGVKSDSVTTLGVNHSF